MSDHSYTNLSGRDGAPVPLRAVEMRGEVLGGTLHMTLRQRYENLEQKPVEALYTFPVPAEATLINFVMESGGRRCEASVIEREAAFETYQHALMTGDGAALLDQERANVFSASVGNLLPGETTVIELEYLQPLHAHEGALRIALPTLVAPRYMPGAAAGPRTAHGWADPTTRVPDADRISPPVGRAQYTLSLELMVPGAADLSVESPGHRLATTTTPTGLCVRLADEHVLLDRDVVILLQGLTAAAQSSVLTHRTAEVGHVLVSHLPELVSEAVGAQQAVGLNVVFVLDRSGSMAGGSLPEAQKALRLCLRQLREGDRFSIIAFDDQPEAFRDELVPFTQKSLEQADAWATAIAARGGTELLEPLVQALSLLAPGRSRQQRTAQSCIVLLTDGQVGNTDEITEAVLAKAGATAIHCFGIGTNVSEDLLVQLAKRTQGGIELIHPGERIDDKVVSTFARAIAPRVRDLQLKWVDVEMQDLAPAEPPTLIDGVPWVIHARYRKPGRGALELRGTLDGAPWYLRLPLTLPERAELPSLPKLWAAERVRDLELLELQSSRSESCKARIVALSTEHGIASRYTSFVVRETRGSERRAKTPAEVRVIAVSAPAAWNMLRSELPDILLSARMSPVLGAPLSPPSSCAPLSPMDALPSRPAQASDSLPASPARRAPTSKRRPQAPARAAARVSHDAGGGRETAERDPAFEILAGQLASGLWDRADDAADAKLRQLLATSDQLLALLRLGIDGGHTKHGPLVRKALAPLVQLAASLAQREPEAAERALSIAWLSAAGMRTRRMLRATMERAGLHALADKLADEAALRAALLG